MIGTDLSRQDDQSQTRAPNDRSRIGRVVANTGRDILVMVDGHAEARLNLRLGDVLVMAGTEHGAVGVVSGMNVPAPGLDSDGVDLWLAQVEIVGTLNFSSDGPDFSLGIPLPPALGEVAYKASRVDLRRLFRNGSDETYPVGTVIGQNDVAATVDGDGLLENGFAILGNSGSGKSCTLASLIRALLRHRHPVKTLLIDPHNEYANSFGRAATTIEPTPGLFPHWLLSLDEFAWVLSSNGGELDEAEHSLLEEAIPAARVRFLQRGASPRERSSSTLDCVSVDGPVPYRVTDLVGFLDKNVLTDETRPSMAYKRLRTRIMAAIGDPRLSVIFGNVASFDNLEQLISRLFSSSSASTPLAILQLGQLSSGVDRLVVSVVCRIAAALAEWGNGARRFLIAIDDMERFAPQDGADRVSELSRSSIRSLGGRPRKLGGSLAVVSSHPRSVCRAVLAQCTTFFVHRLPSASDTEAVEEMMPEAATAFLANAGNLAPGETIGVGRGVPLSARIAIAPLPVAAIPSGHGSNPVSDVAGHNSIEAMVHRWRYRGTVDWQPDMDDGESIAS